MEYSELITKEDTTLAVLAAFPEPPNGMTLDEIYQRMQIGLDAVAKRLHARWVPAAFEEAARVADTFEDRYLSINRLRFLSDSYRKGV